MKKFLLALVCTSFLSTQVYAAGPMSQKRHSQPQQTYSSRDGRQNNKTYIKTPSQQPTKVVYKEVYRPAPQPTTVVYRDVYRAPQVTEIHHHKESNTAGIVALSFAGILGALVLAVAAAN